METHEIERLIRISKEHPLLPETYIPWQDDPLPGDVFLPERLNSLHGLPVYDTLTPGQKLDLGRHETVQVMYSYGWGEQLFCLFVNRYILDIPPHHAEHRFLIREVIEEYRHQEMFTQAIMRLNGDPVKPTRWHRFAGTFTAKYLPPDFMFMTGLSVELVTDKYGYYLRKEPGVYNVLKKVNELHSIEEGRHIHFTKGLLERYTAKAGFFKKTLYSLLVLGNIYFLRSLYIRKEIYQRIGIPDPEKLYRIAYRNYKAKFAENCLGGVVEFVNDFGGFNLLTRPLWKSILGVRF
ncbi:diiron oxygenase [Hufsiella ginkgonis]|uniref:Diiron oxygenase n=1 Tax=Hufsiella ginkgonis TaxID=2695274 RepID=A0A7K1XXL9_9SPHI|nr:diiron oxygenase [Hufsiella ginkgonis]MXV15740.1 hypothetical protein [Hufsiella ginkgonis]